MRNKKLLVILPIFRKVIGVFSEFFLNIYLYKVVDGDLNFILSYIAYTMVLAFIFNYLNLSRMNSRNAVKIFHMSFVCEVVAMLILIIAKENIISLIWLFGAVHKYAMAAYYNVYETVLIKSAKNTSLSSYVAGVSILESIVGLLAPAMIGFVISDYSYEIAFVLILINALVAMYLGSKVDFMGVDHKFSLMEYWGKARRSRNMRMAYLICFLKRLGGRDGVIGNLLPILLFLSLGTEFSAGSYDSLFSVVYMILLEVVRVLNRRGARKRFYVPFAMLAFISAIVMVANFNVTTVLIFYLTVKTGMAMVQTESASMVYAIGIKERLAKYTREHVFTWNIFLQFGHLLGVLVAYIVYNYFYSKEVLATIIVILTGFTVLQAYFLQKIEAKLGNK